jgi:hypothetical protein
LERSPATWLELFEYFPIAVAIGGLEEFYRMAEAGIKCMGTLMISLGKVGNLNAKNGMESLL